MNSIDRRKGLTLEEFQEVYAKPQKPVILTDATQNWKAMEWTPEYLAQKAPEAEVQAIPTASRTLRETVRMSLKDYVNYYQAPDERKLYMVNWVFARDCPELLSDFEVPVYFKEDWFLETNDPPDLLWIFLGPADSGLFMHLDVGHSPAWNVQLSGTKSWKLWAPDQQDFLYGGKVDAFDPDLKLYPEFAKAQAIETEVGPGECIFVPSLWWHQTKNIDAGMALTANYVDRFSYDIVVDKLKDYPEYHAFRRDLRRVARGKLRAGRT